MGQGTTSWTPIISRHSLSTEVLAVARTIIEGAWAAYIGAVSGLSTQQDQQHVLDFGTKMWEDSAKAIFPQFKELPYAQ